MIRFYLFLIALIVSACSTTQPEQAGLSRTESLNRSNQLYQKGNDLYRNRRYGEAIPYLKEAHKLNPQNEKVLNRLAMIEFKRENFAAAADIYNRSCALTIKNYGTNNMRIVGCYSLLARSLVQSGRPWEATKYFTRAYEYMIVAKGMNFVDHYLWLSNLTEHLERLGEYETAVTYYEKFLKNVRYSDREYKQIQAKLRLLRKLIERSTGDA